ncbi:Uncharacterised protein [Mycobacteroides abscessus subsp. abscessus]|nr:Uncharacterised protein [Mycobacteroides abscessus subsp. abscessus]
MTSHDDDGRREEDLLRPEQAVGDPRAEDRGEEDGTAVGADDADRCGLRKTEAAIGDLEVQVQGQDAVHAVVGEALPQFEAEELHERQRVSEEPRIARDDLSRPCARRHIVLSVVSCHHYEA